jgi:hypothetical protein
MNEDRALDIDSPPFDCSFNHFAGGRVERTKMQPPTVEDLNLAMQSIPSVKAISAMASPSPAAADRTQTLQVVEYGRLWYALCHAPPARP